MLENKKKYKYLKDYDYNYFGFDVSKSMIDEAKHIWDKPNLNFWCADWDDFTFEHNCDCMLLLGVLPYADSKYCDNDYVSPFELYKMLVNKFNPRQVIIRETESHDGFVSIEGLESFIKIADHVERFTVDTMLGKKVVLNVVTDI